MERQFTIDPKVCVWRFRQLGLDYEASQLEYMLKTLEKEAQEAQAKAQPPTDENGESIHETMDQCAHQIEYKHVLQELVNKLT
jgi:hypothetical protein